MKDVLIVGTIPLVFIAVWYFNMLDSLQEGGDACDRLCAVEYSRPQDKKASSYHIWERRYLCCCETPELLQCRWLEEGEAE